MVNVTWVKGCALARWRVLPTLVEQGDTTAIWRPGLMVSRTRVETKRLGVVNEL